MKRKSPHVTSAAAGGDESVIYKVPAALALLILVLTALRRLHHYYATLDGFTTLRPLLRVAAISFAVLFAISLVGLLLTRRRLFGYCTACFGLLAATCALLYVGWLEYTLQIYLMHVLVYVLYMIWQLYRMEFTLFSLMTGFAGMVFYLLSRGIHANVRTILPCVLLAAVLLVCGALALLCERGKGALRLGTFRLVLFPASFSPVILCFTCVLWLLVLLACLVFGPTCAFYCMFAAIALELVGAVYYTFQLK